MHFIEHQTNESNFFAIRLVQASQAKALHEAEAAAAAAASEAAALRSKLSSAAQQAKAVSRQFQAQLAALQQEREALLSQLAESKAEVRSVVFFVRDVQYAFFCLWPRP